MTAVTSAKSGLVLNQTIYGSWLTVKEEEMKRKVRIAGISVGVFGGVVIAFFVVGLVGLEYYSFFAPKYRNVERKVFENTKSYVQGIQQDLGKYYLEYQNGTQDKKDAIKATIQMRFAEVDSSKLQSAQLRTFLTQTRGY